MNKVLLIKGPHPTKLNIICFKINVTQSMDALWRTSLRTRFPIFPSIPNPTSASGDGQEGEIGCYT